MALLTGLYHPTNSPSPRVCLSKSCLACSLVMRLLPFTYSLNFCKTQGTSTLGTARPRHVVSASGTERYAGQVKGRSRPPQGPPRGERKGLRLAPRRCSISPQPCWARLSHPGRFGAVWGTQRKRRGNASSERGFCQGRTVDCAPSRQLR